MHQPIPQSQLASWTKGFADLKMAIDSKDPNDNVTAIVHGTLMANMQTAFKLQVVPEFPLPLLLTIPAIAGIIAATSLFSFRRNLSDGREIRNSPTSNR